MARRNKNKRENNPLNKIVHKAVNNYNNKIKRENKKGNFNTPETVKYSDVRGITDLAELDHKISEMKLFSSTRGNTKLIQNENGIVLTKYEIDLINKKNEEINKVRDENYAKYKDKKVRNFGAEQEYTVDERLRFVGGGELDRIKRHREFNFESIRSKRELELYLESTEKQYQANYMVEKGKLYKENYLKGCEKALGKRNRNKIEKVLNGISADDFIEQYYTDVNGASIDYVYDEHEERAERTNSIIDFWKDFKS